MSVKAILYHANWCGYCKIFKPEWDELVELVKTNGNNNIQLESYEEAQLEAKNATINGKPIRGYPTVKIILNKDGTTKEIEYQGKRKADELYAHLKRLLS